MTAATPLSDMSYGTNVTSHWDGSSATQAATRTTCQCLQRVVLLLEALEDHATRVEHQAVDTSLAYHKEVLGQLRTLTHCLRCTSRSDHMVMLVVLCDKMAGLYEKVIITSKQIAKLQTRNGKIGENILEQNIFFGDYEIDTVAEWIQVIKGVVKIHLQKMSDLLERIKTLSAKESRESRLLMLQAAEETVARLAAEVDEIMGVS